MQHLSLTLNAAMLTNIVLTLIMQNFWNIAWRSHCMSNLYQKQIQYYNWTAYDTLTNDIGKILPKFLTDNRQKHGTILASILGNVASTIIGLAYEGISSFLHHKRHKALHKAVAVMKKKTDIQQNRIHHLEDTMCMYGVYNADNFDRPYRHSKQNAKFHYLEWKDFHRKISWLDGDIFSRWRHAQLCHKFCTISDYSTRTICENVWKIYWGTEIIFQRYKSFSKGYLLISLLRPSTLEKILREVRIAIAKSNKDYDLVLTKLYLYYDMKLVTFGMDNQRNLIVQFPVFVQPYTQKRLWLCIKLKLYGSPP